MSKHQIGDRSSHNHYDAINSESQTQISFMCLRLIRTRWSFCFLYLWINDPSNIMEQFKLFSVLLRSSLLSLQPLKSHHFENSVISWESEENIWKNLGSWNVLKKFLRNFDLECKKKFLMKKIMASENNGDHRSEPEITITVAESSNKSSLIVVSNRLPFVLKKNADGSMYRQARWENRVHLSLKFCGFTTMFPWCVIEISTVVIVAPSSTAVCKAKNKVDKWERLYFVQSNSSEVQRLNEELKEFPRSLVTHKAIKMYINCAISLSLRKFRLDAIFPCNLSHFYEMNTECCSREKISQDYRLVVLIVSIVWRELNFNSISGTCLLHLTLSFDQQQKAFLFWRRIEGQAFYIFQDIRYQQIKENNVFIGATFHQ